MEYFEADNNDKQSFKRFSSEFKLQGSPGTIGHRPVQSRGHPGCLQVLGQQRQLVVRDLVQVDGGRHRSRFPTGFLVLGPAPDFVMVAHRSRTGISGFLATPVNHTTTILAYSTLQAL